MRKRVTFKEFQDLLPFGRTKFYKYKKQGLFPKGCEDGNVYWPIKDVKAWLTAYDAGLRGDELKAFSIKIVRRREALFNGLFSK